MPGAVKRQERLVRTGDGSSPAYEGWEMDIDASTPSKHGSALPLLVDLLHDAIEDGALWASCRQSR